MYKTENADNNTFQKHEYHIPITATAEKLLRNLPKSKAAPSRSLQGASR